MHQLFRPSVTSYLLFVCFLRRHWHICVRKTCCQWYRWMLISRESLMIEYRGKSGLTFMLAITSGCTAHSGPCVLPSWFQVPSYGSLLNIAPDEGADCPAYDCLRQTSSSSPAFLDHWLRSLHYRLVSAWLVWKSNVATNQSERKGKGESGWKAKSSGTWILLSALM